MKDVETFLAKEFDGKLFVLVYMTTFQGSYYTLSKVHYTVLNGVAYEIQGKRLTKSGDTMINLKTSCKKIGVYNPEKEYKTTHKEFSYSELRKKFKI